MKKKYKLKEWCKNDPCYHFIIIEDGHTMLACDIAKGLNDKELLLKERKELEKQNEESKDYADILKMSLSKSADRCIELGNQNEELISYLIYSCFNSIEMWIDTSDDRGEQYSFSEWKKANIIKCDLLEKIKQMPIEEILKEV